MVKNTEKYPNKRYYAACKSCGGYFIKSTRDPNVVQDYCHKCKSPNYEKDNFSTATSDQQYNGYSTRKHQN